MKAAEPRTTVAIGMCKGTSSAVDFDELNLPDRLAPAMQGYSSQAHRYLFSRSGFTPRPERHADSDPALHLVTPADSYA